MLLAVPVFSLLLSFQSDSCKVTTVDNLTESSSGNATSAPSPFLMSWTYVSVLSLDVMKHYAFNDYSLKVTYPPSASETSPNMLINKTNHLSCLFVCLFKATLQVCQWDLVSAFLSSIEKRSVILMRHRLVFACVPDVLLIQTICSSPGLIGSRWFDSAALGHI